MMGASIILEKCIILKTRKTNISDKQELLKRLTHVRLKQRKFKVFKIGFREEIIFKSDLIIKCPFQLPSS